MQRLHLLLRVCISRFAVASKRLDEQKKFVEKLVADKEKLHHKIQDLENQRLSQTDHSTYETAGGSVDEIRIQIKHKVLVGICFDSWNNFFVFSLLYVLFLCVLLPFIGEWRLFVIWLSLEALDQLAATLEL